MYAVLLHMNMLKYLPISSSQSTVLTPVSIDPRALCSPGASAERILWHSLIVRAGSPCVYCALIIGPPSGGGARNPIAVHRARRLNVLRRPVPDDRRLADGFVLPLPRAKRGVLVSRVQLASFLFPTSRRSSSGSHRILFEEQEVRFTSTW